MFAVDDIDELVARMQSHGAEVIGRMEYEKSYRLACIRGPEGIIVGLDEQFGEASAVGQLQPFIYRRS
jgi:predicted enzyme related to lactoylglutathione lyase